MRPLPARLPDPSDTLLARLARLVRLELELALTETRQLVRTVVLCAAVGFIAAAVLIASILILVTGAFAPLFGAPWEHFVIAGGAAALLALASVTACGWRVRTLPWPKETLTSFEENWRWLAAQLRSRLTLR